MKIHTEELPLINDTLPLRSLGILTVCPEVAPVPLPLAEVNATARVADRIAEVILLQKFRNSYDQALEAVYIFPLAGGAAVREFELRVGSRTIRGAIQEREEARKKYQKALDEGKRTALLEQERDDVFTVRVGNLPPKEEIIVRIVYSERLPFLSDGTTELRIPLVVSPRYISGSPLKEEPVGEGFEPDTDLVQDASRISPPRLAPGCDPNVALSIEVDLLDGDIANLSCTQHAVKTKTATASTKVTLIRQDELMNQDFVIRWQLASDILRPSLLACKDEEKTYCMLSILPPRSTDKRAQPRDVVFVLDRSGSMEGVKMTSAARACSTLLSTLNPKDRFAILAFDDRVEWLKSDLAIAGPFLNCDESGLTRGHQYLREVSARGGTELLSAINGSLAAISGLPQDPERIAIVVVITDGQIGDESRVLKSVQSQAIRTRIFTVGVDTAVNRSFLERLARSGGGTSIFVEPGTQLEDALRLIGREIGNPLLVDVTLADVDLALDATTITPAPLPDLFEGHGTTVFFCSQMTGNVKLKGKFNDSKQYEEVVHTKEVDLPAIAHLWARSHVMDLEDRYRLNPSQQETIRRQIIELALRHHLLTRFTAFVVVDETEVVNADGSRRKIVQPVHMPARWEMGKTTPQGAPSIAMAMASFSDSAAPITGSFSPMAIFEKAVGHADARLRSIHSAAPTEAQKQTLEAVLQNFAKALERLRNPSSWNQPAVIEFLKTEQRLLLLSLTQEPASERLPRVKEFVDKDLSEFIATLEASANMTYETFLPDLDLFFLKLNNAMKELQSKQKSTRKRFWNSSV